MPLRVIGAGFGRTGTASLKQALEIVGFAPCYHMFEVNKQKQGAQPWLAASRGQPVDWDQVLEGYQAVVDWPACAFYRELHARYPEARVILGVREAESWYQSARETIYPISHAIPRWFFLLHKRARVMHAMIESVIWQGTFDGRFLDEPEHAKTVFLDHIETVRREIPAAQLLVFDVREGWEPLCAFLDVPVPGTPFPRVNDAYEMKSAIRRIKTGFSLLHGAFVLGFALLSTIVIRAFNW